MLQIHFFLVRSQTLASLASGPTQGPVLSSKVVASNSQVFVSMLRRCRMGLRLASMAPRLSFRMILPVASTNSM